MNRSPSASAVPTPAPILRVDSGQMAALVDAKDWSSTPLGPFGQWPQSLRTTVSLCVASNFPIAIIWGPQRVQIYNDGYLPVCGDKHPTSLGQNFKECWASAWEVIGESFEQAWAGQARFLENQRIFLDRFGYLEETFFNFSFSPILDESGGVGGLFHPVTELTQYILAGRRLNILRTVAERTAAPYTEPETAALLLETFRAFALDLPFVALYALGPGAEQARLEGQVGLDHAAALGPATVALAEGTDGTWPLAEAARTGTAQRVEQLATAFGAFASGPYPEAPHTALVYPLRLGGSAQPAYFLVLGVSARRVLDAEYVLFLDLLAGATTTALAKARTLAEERQRADALAELDRAKTAFFNNISHEFRTPLTLMLGPLDDALADSTHPLAASQQARLTLVQRNTRRLQRLVNSLLDFARIEAGRLQADFAPLDLAAHTAELASVFESAVATAGLTFAVDCPPLSAPAYVDADLWEKVVFNLLSNALKFTFAGSIRVSLREEGDHAVLRVQDTGEGMAAAELPKLFTRFYRAEGTRSRSHEGSGIGLAFVQELVQLHGGTITAESQLGQGSTFAVRLPLGAAHLSADRVRPAGPNARLAGQSAAFVEETRRWLPDADRVPGDPPSPPGELPAAAAAATILVVDDNADMRAYVQHVLAQQPQWTVRTAADGAQALEAVARQQPDLIVSDVMMPHLDGFGLLQILKQHPDTARIPVVLLSARAGEEAVLEGLAQGADDYLVKPFAARELLARVRTQLGITRTRQDNTRLRATEEELKKFKVLSDHAFDAFILMRPDASFAYLNALALQRWGYTAAEAAQLRVPDVDPVYQGDVFRAVFAEAQRLGAVPPFETRHRRKDGSTFPVEVSMGGLTLDGQPHLFAIARDITAQKHHAAALHESEQRFRLLADATPTLVWATRPDATIRYINRAFADFVGATPAQYAATGWGPYLHPDERESTQGTLAEAVGAHACYRLEHRLRHHDGEYRWLLAQGAPSYLPSGELYGYVGSAIDITPQKALEAGLRDAKASAESSARAKQDFLAHMSHEIRTPMNAIQGMGRLLTKTTLNPPQTKYLHAIAASADNLLVIIDDILDWSKIDAGQLDLDVVDCSLRRVCAQVKQTLQYKAEEKGLALVTHVGAGVPAVLRSDPQRLTQVLLNLAGNAVKFTERGRVRVSLALVHAPADGVAEVAFTVQDTGVGIDPAYLARAFDDFSQQDASVSRRFGGTGLGLGISRRLVALLGGELHLTSTPGQGTTARFTLSLPLGAAQHLPKKCGADASRWREALRGRRVLLVEDNVFNRLLARVTLEQAGLDVAEAEDGAAAVAAVRAAARPFDAVLMDVHMPVMNGYEATAVLRGELGPVLPIIALTANATTGERAKCLAAGMNEYLSKPFQEDDLLRMLYQWVVEPGASVNFAT